MRNTAKTTGNDDIRTFIKTVSSKPASALLDVLNIRDEASHIRAVELVGALMDVTGDEPEHPLYRVINLLADAIGRYEDQIYAPVQANPVKVLKYLMETQGLKQADIADIFGSQGAVSDIMTGRRKLNNLEQIRKLAERLHVDPSVFV